jgi:hypothetical protein
VRRSGPTFSARAYGDEGEAAFVSYLAGALPEEYVAINGLLVARHLDADVILVGPTGIWVYEVKHWSSEIICQDGQWRRIKTYRQPGGRLVQEHEMLRPFDKQWLREANAVKETLRRRLPQHPNLHEYVGGGLVFTHGGSSFSADNTCKARVYTEVLRGSSLRISRGTRLHDAGPSARYRHPPQWSDRLHERQGEAPWETSSSVELAERLHEEALSQALSYISDIGELSGSELSGVVISEEVKEASKRAVWHPHPDGPPKD